jgi:predicted GNAT family N-acyltransferase
LIQADQAGSGLRTFRVALIFLIQDKALLARIAPDQGDFGDRSPVVDHEEIFRFTAEAVGDEEELLRRLAVFRMQDRPGQVVLISDLLAVRAPAAGGRGSKTTASELALRIRDTFRSGQHLCGMISLTDPPGARVSDIDASIPRDADPAALRATIIRVATGLRLKARPPARPDAATAAAGVKVEAVQSKEQLRACFALRKKIYGLMGYLPDRIMADRSGLEMDCYDVGSVHFAAMRGGEVVGTARLVTQLPAEPSNSEGFSIDAIRTCMSHRTWADQIAEEAGGAVRDRVNCPCFMQLPILQSADFSDRWPEMLKLTSSAAELSRVVVAPSCRGLGVSKTLVEIVESKACQLGIPIILLECIPAHSEMYGAYGFKRLGGEPHVRSSDLDQYAVGMWFRFDAANRTASKSAEDRLRKILMQLLPRFGPIDVAVGWDKKRKN